nr:hypothetical protein BaRGS_033324 [Batillaria attramentaria]
MWGGVGCNGKVVFVLSKNFNNSEECQFLVQFAKTLDPYAKQQKLIPLVIDKNVKLPRVLEGLVCINYNAALRENWLGRRLWEAVHEAQAQVPAQTQHGLSGKRSGTGAVTGHRPHTGTGTVTQAHTGTGHRHTGTGTGTGHMHRHIDTDTD